jgi:hypothetical protein
MLDISPDSTKNKFRRARILMLTSLVEQVLAEKGTCKIIDIGGTQGFWETWKEFFDFSRTSVLCVNMDPEHANYGETNPAVKMRAGDARDLSFCSDNEYDIAFSNSVIEHVGLWRDMERMAREVQRVSHRYLVQTPYFWFPVEPHARTPFIHWLPDSIKYRILLYRRCGFWEKQDTVSGAVSRVQSAIMLDIRQMRTLFPDAELNMERFFGWPKSLIAIKRS